MFLTNKVTDATLCCEYKRMICLYLQYNLATGALLLVNQSDMIKAKGC